MKSILASQIVLTILLSGVHAAVLHVPSEYATIQEALNVVSDGDSVLVSPAVYIEALQSPPISFTMIGDVAPDSALQNLPVIDPSTLPHSNELACLSFEQSVPSIRIERMAFRNGPLMYPRNSAGGIDGHVSDLSLKQCLFDSTYYGIVRTDFFNDLIELDSCIFLNNPVGCVSAEGYQVTARNCSFSGRGFALVNCSEGSEFVSCRFRGAASGYHLLLHGSNVRVEGCDFGGLAEDGTVYLELAHTSGLVKNNVFANGQFAQTALHVRQNCQEPISIVGNIFQHLVEITPLVIECDDSGNEFARIDSNLFTQNANSGAKAIQIEPDVNTQLYRNKFMFLSPPERNTIYSASSEVMARENVFVETGMAYRAFQSNDARFNYWSDATGPYHPTLNPSGLGDSVSNFVEFSPWYPDTSFLINGTRIPVELPLEFSLSVYPNPFNSTTRISLFAPDPFIGVIELVNVLGETVREIHRGPLYGRMELPFAADNLSSGIYFLNTRDIIKNSVRNTQKIVLIR